MYTNRDTPGALGRRREPDRAEVVDVVRHLADPVADRVVRQLGHVHDRVEAHQVVRRDVPDVLDQGVRRLVHAVVEPPVLVVAGVEAGDVVAAPEQGRGEQAAR